MQLVQYMVDGGILMVPIVVCSIVALAAFVERMFSVRRARLAPAALVLRVLELARAGRFDDALAVSFKSENAGARILRTALENRHLSREAIKERLEEAGRREAVEMERYIPILGTIATIAPLLGLLGTVGGMIETFDVIEAKRGVQDVGELAGGIRVALVTTFAGLCVGIPALVGNRYLLARVDGVLQDLEEASLQLLDLVGKTKTEDEDAE